MITGTKVNFVYVASGASIPTPVDESTIYYLEDAQQMYVGAHLIADSSKIQDIKINGSSAIDPSTHEVNIELPYNICIKSIPSTPTAIANFTDGAEMVMPSLTVGVEAVQDLHGYDSPWVGGVGKNKLPLNVSNIKANNTNGTWSENAYTESGVTFTLLTDNGGNITGIKTNGTASANIYFVLSEGELNWITFDGSYIINGCSNGSSTTYAIQVHSNESSSVRIDNFNQDNYIQSSSSTYTIKNVMIVIRNGYTASNLMFYPMIRLRSVTDATFAPYSNICPISGWSEANVGVSGVNIWDEEWEIIGNVLNSKNYIPVKPNTQYYITPHYGRDYICYDSQFNIVKNWTWLSTLYPAFTTPSNCYYIKFRMTSEYGTTYNNDISMNYPSSDTSYHAYNGHTYTIDLNGTRYGGRVEIVNGVARFVATKEYIASYNGETLPSDWISDRDVYSEGATPTIGAEVVYTLATPTIIPLGNYPISSLEGVNNVFADSGEILEGEYIANSSYVVDVAESIIKLGVDDITLTKNFADEYDASTSYSVGDLCTKDLVLYRCTTATTGTWDDTKWESATIAEILDAIKTVINSLMVDIDIEVISRLIQKDELLDIMNYGDQLNINWADGTTNYDMPLNLCHLETAKDENDNDVKVADFESEYVLPFDCVFDAPEAIFASASDLEAGDYYFKIVNDAWGGNNGKYVSFTLDATLEAGKQIRKKSGGYDAAIENCTLGIFTDGADTIGTTLSFTVNTVQPSTGTNLGQTDGTGDLNHWHCVVLGYNRWKYSAIRQFLNSDATAGNWWTQQHKWDVMPAYATTKNGFLYGLSASVKQYLVETKVYTLRNTVFNSGDIPLGGMDETLDKVFLISLEQSYIEPQITGEGEYWEYYKNLLGTNAPVSRSSTYPLLIKYDIGGKTTARYRWLRSAYRGSTYGAWFVYTSGGVYSTYVSYGYRCAPCLRIGISN